MQRLAGTLAILLLVGCASDDGYSGSSSVSVGASFYYGTGWYGSPYYGYPPGYVVVPPDYVDRPGEPGRPGGPGGPDVGPRPEQPIANPPSAAQPKASSRMPSAQPRVSSSSMRSSIPRGGGGRRR
jgi:hypothetical protein